MARAELRKSKVLELSLAEFGDNGKIAEKLGITTSRVGQILRDSYTAISRDRQDLQGLAFEKRMLQLSEVKREARALMLRVCPICNGKDDGIPNNKPCEACAATGRFYEVDDRVKGMDRLFKALQEEAKIFGDYEVAQINITIRTDQYREDIARMSDGEVMEIIRNFGDIIDANPEDIEDADFTPISNDRPPEKRALLSSGGGDSDGK